MSDDSGNSEMRDSEEIDPGEPIAALAEFEPDISSGLVGRIRRAIHRRTTVDHLTAFSVHMPLLVLRELWLILVKRLDPMDVRKDASHGGKTS
jgi:hypothetical protein